MLGLRLGGVTALVMLTLLVANDPLSDVGSVLLWVVPIAWSLVAARCLAGESGHGVLTPWHARWPASAVDGPRRGVVHV